MPRKSIGERPMTDAERQARCRAARASGTPAVRIRRPLDHRSRAKRWRDAVSELITVQDHYAAWLEALPESLQDSATADACDLRPRPHGTSGNRSAARLRPRLTRATLSARRAGANRAGSSNQQLLANPRSPRPRNPDQLRRGERYRPRPSQGGGQFWTPIGGHFSTPIDTFDLIASVHAALLAGHIDLIFLWSDRALWPR